MRNPELKPGSGGYGALTALLVVLLLCMGALAGLNSMFTQRAVQDMGGAADIARQHAQPRAIVATTRVLRSNLGARRFLGRSIKDIDAMVGGMDAALLALPDPATSSAPRFNIPLLRSPVNHQTLQELRQLWSEFHHYLDPIRAFEADPYIETAEQGTQLSAAGLALQRALDEALRFGQANQQQISTLIGELSTGAANTAQTRAAMLRQWLVIGLGACALLLIITLLLIWSASRREQALARAKQQSDDILRTVNQGLFLLDERLQIGSERSEALQEIFRRRDFDKLDFQGLLRGLVPEKTLETAAEYVTLLWGERVNEKLIKSINPLSEVEVHFEAPGGKVDTQYLEFDFNRVRSGGQFSRVLVSVNDVTRRVELARELHESQEKAQAQLDLLLHILHVDPQLLTAFLEESAVSLKMVNAILKEPAREESAFRAKLDGIFRQIHSVKGEAAALGLKSVEQHAHGFEEALVELRNRPTVGGNDFLPLVVKLDDLFAHFSQMREMISRLADLRTAMSGLPPAATDLNFAASPEATTPSLTAEEERAQSQQDEQEWIAPQPESASEPEPASASAPAEEEPAQAPASSAGDTLVQRPPEALEQLRQSAAGGDIESAITQLAQRIARKQSKKVEVNCSGLERVPSRYRRPIKDIAIQMVRNSLAHGIEMPQERAQQNKSAAGAIVVRFENHGSGGCEFVCQDDGRGLSIEQLKQTAVARNLVSAEQAATLDERRALALIFMAGFSTQEQADEDSGRGVGMDLVRTTVQELGGKIGISTAAGKFLRFRIWLPPTAEAQAA